MSSFLKKDKTVLVLAVVVFSLFAAAFIYNTSFVIDGTRYFSLFDDAMISMTCARHFVAGEGLVMNPGERVEGFTGPLWTAVMAAVHYLPLPIQKTSIVVQIVGAILLVTNLLFILSIAHSISNKASHVASAAVILTAVCLPLINWTLQGMETGFAALLIDMAVFFALPAMKKNRVPLLSFILLAAATLVRLDLAFIAAAAIIYLALTGRDKRRANMLTGALVLAGFLAVQTAVRMVYYGSPLPNSYYLTMTGYPFLLRIIRGLLVFGNFAAAMNIFLFAVPFIGIAIRPSKERGLLMTVIATQSLLSIAAGGGAHEDLHSANLRIAIVLPLFYVLFADSMSRMINALQKVLADNDTIRNGVIKHLPGHAFGIILILSFFSFNFAHDPISIKGMLMLSKPYNTDLNRESVERSLLIRRITSPQATIAAAQVGALSYFSERPVVDFLGRTDPVIARRPMHRAQGIAKFRHFRPGYLKYDYSYSIGERKPDAILQIWGDFIEADEFIAGEYTRLSVKEQLYFLKNGSENVLWAKFMGNK